MSVNTCKMVFLYRSGADRAMEKTNLPTAPLQKLIEKISSLKKIAKAVNTKKNFFSVNCLKGG